MKMIMLFAISMIFLLAPAAAFFMEPLAENPVGKRRDDPDTHSFGTLYSGIPFMEDTLAILDGRIEITPVEAVQ